MHWLSWKKQKLIINNESLLQLMKAVQPAIKAKVAAEAEANLNKNSAKTLNLPEMPFISMSNAVSV